MKFLVASLAIALALALVGCKRSQSARPAPAKPAQASQPAAAPATPPREPSPPDVISRTRPIMATVFAIQVTGVQHDRADPAITQAFDEIERLEGVLSEWKADSEISRINASAGVKPVPVGDDTLTVVEAGVAVSKWSDGAFDLSWAALRDVYDFRPGQERLPTPEELAARLPLVQWRDIVVDRAKRTVFLRRKGMAIGTGGIAKGYALDRAGDLLEKAGITSYMLFGGGQVQVRGLKGDRPWRVGVQHPRKGDRYFGFAEATDASISTSGDYEHAFFDKANKRYHHIIDTKTGQSATASISVTILSTEGLYADALSTAVFILGPEKGQALLRSLPFEASAVIVDAKCRLVLTGRAKEQLALRTELTDGALPDCAP